MHPIDDSYPPEPGRFLRDQVRDLRENKADKAVIKSEIRRVEDRIKDATDDVDDLKDALAVKKSHICLHEGDLGEMKKAIEENSRRSQDAFKTASLASDRGFKILMGAVMGFVTFGVAFVVWAVNVSYTADDAYKKVESIEKAVEDQVKKEMPPPQIIIATPEYMSDRLENKKPITPEPGAAVDLGGMLEQALTNALEKQADPLSNL